MMKKVILMLIILSLLACEKTLIVESKINTNLEENWCVDYPAKLSKSSTYDTYNFEFENELYFFSFPDLYTMQIFKMNKNEKIVREVGISNPPLFGLKEIKEINRFDNMVVIINNRSVYLLDLKTSTIIYENPASSGALSFYAYIFENDLYMIQSTNDGKNWQLAKVDLTTFKNEILVDLKNEDIGHFEINKARNGNKQMISYPSYGFAHINLTSKKKVVGKMNAEIDGFAREFYYDKENIFTAGNSFIKFNLNTGTIIWNKKLDQHYNFPSNILKDSNSILLATSKGVLSKYNIANGEIIWSSEKMPDGFYRITAMNGFIYMSDGKKLFVINSSNGEIVLQRINNFQIGQPLFIDSTKNLIYSPKDGRFCEFKGL
jgi:hypothetical protein